MQYLVAHYWQSAKHNASSMVLQQVYHKRRRMPVVLACIITDLSDGHMGRVITDSLADWFYESGLPLCGRYGERGMQIISDSLAKCLRHSMEQGERETARKNVKHPVAGVLCVGHSLLIFRQGGQKITLFNTRNNRSHSRELTGERRGAGLIFQNAIVESNVGILLATEGMHKAVPAGVMEECLNVRELRSQTRMDRRLQELCSLGEKNGGVDMGAVLLIRR